MAVAIAHISPLLLSAPGTPRGVRGAHASRDIQPLVHPDSRCQINVGRVFRAVCEFPAKNVEILRKSCGWGRQVMGQRSVPSDLRSALTWGDQASAIHDSGLESQDGVGVLC